MKLSFLLIGLLFSLNTFASNKVLKCELFEDDQFLREGTTQIDENGQAQIDMGQQDIHFFSGFVWDGFPGVMIMSPEKSHDDLSESMSVKSSTGSTLTITCSII